MFPIGIHFSESNGVSKRAECMKEGFPSITFQTIKKFMEKIDIISTALKSQEG